MLAIDKSIVYECVCGAQRGVRPQDYGFAAGDYRSLFEAVVGENKALCKVNEDGTFHYRNDQKVWLFKECGCASVAELACRWRYSYKVAMAVLEEAGVCVKKEVNLQGMINYLIKCEHATKDGMFCDYTFFTCALTSVLNDVVRLREDDKEFYGDFTYTGIEFNWYINDNPPSEYEEDWVMLEIWVGNGAENVSKKFGRVAWERDDWNKALEYIGG